MGHKEPEKSKKSKKSKNGNAPRRWAPGRGRSMAGLAR